MNLQFREGHNGVRYVGRGVDAPRFRLGNVLITPGASALAQRHDLKLWRYLARHANGDWGDLSPEDKDANEYALGHKMRVLSSYQVGDRERLWIMTEHDRSTTTFLLMEEYHSDVLERGQM